MESSIAIDYDGDGNVSGGISDEVNGLYKKLGTAIVTYGAEHQTPICYCSDSFPNWFVDTDGDGACSADEAMASNAFTSWTARLVRATYNYQMVHNDPGAFAHNAKYVIELIYDAITDLNTALVAKVDMSKANRTDVGHFDGADETFPPLRRPRIGRPPPARSCHGGEKGFRFSSSTGSGRPCTEPSERARVRHLPQQPGDRLHLDHRRPLGDLPLGRHRQ